MTHIEISENVRDRFEIEFGYRPRVRSVRAHTLQVFKSAVTYLAQNATTPQTAIISLELSRIIGSRLFDVNFRKAGLSPVRCGVVKIEMRHGIDASRGERYYYAPDNDRVQTYLELLTRLSV